MAVEVIDYSEVGNRLEAVVPHIGMFYICFILLHGYLSHNLTLGAHLAELTSIMEGNAHYLVDSGHPHLFNLNKLRLISNTLSTLVSK